MAYIATGADLNCDSALLVLMMVDAFTRNYSAQGTRAKERGGFIAMVRPDGRHRVADHRDKKAA